MVTPEDLKAALPKLAGSQTARGLAQPVEAFRDRYGIPHVRAANRRDAFFAQGFVTAQDRLWHMDYDRRRGLGRWAEVVGPAAAEQDMAMRRFRLEASARADYQAVNPQTREMLDAYALGVNAFIETACQGPGGAAEADANTAGPSPGPGALPIEYRIAGLEPEPWQPWDGLVVYKVRHINMGVFESKVWRAQLVRALGPDRVAALFPGYQPRHLLILPPGAPYTGALDDGLEALRRAAESLNQLKETESGSNSWVVAGSRTASGKPILAGDSHRGLDTPNVYYQNHLACPDFDVVGASFPGVPGFPHFGHNSQVAWCVTHTSADYQDLYVEKFRQGDPRYYLLQGQWRRAEVYRETVRVRGSNDIDLKVYVTQHGPVISDNPESGIGIALRYTATDGPSTGQASAAAEPASPAPSRPGKAWPQALGDMLMAQDAHELVESMRPWVDPVNNFLFADVHGNIGYLCRGEIPIRSMDNARLPVPGWTGQQEWRGCIPFEELPRSVNPPEGYIVTANNRPVADDYPHHIALDFAPGFRAERVTHALLSLDDIHAVDMAKVHAEAVSIPALAYIKFLRDVEPRDGLSAQALEKLLAWSGRMDAAAVEPTVYSAFRDALLRRVLLHNLGPELADLAWRPEDRGRGAFLNRLKARLIELILADDRQLLPPGESWPSMMSQALAEAVATLRERLGDDPEQWSWGRIHRTRPRHTLSEAYPRLGTALDPPPMATSGDGDTPLAGSYSTADLATVGSLSVFRYSFDLGDWDRSLWAVPLGSSGHPGSPHYHDQAEMWRRVEMAPMQYDWAQIAAHRESQQVLQPGANA